MISLGHYFLYLVWQPRDVSAANFLFNLRCMVISHVQETCFEVQPRIIDVLTLTEVVPGDRWQIFIKTCRTILAVVSAFYRSWFNVMSWSLSADLTTLTKVIFCGWEVQIMSIRVWDSLVTLVGSLTICVMFMLWRMLLSFFVSPWHLASDERLQFKSPIIITSFFSALATTKTISNDDIHSASKNSDPSGGR